MSLLANTASLTSVAGGTGDTPGSRSSAVSAKITSILSASYADIEIRDALATLDARGLRNTAATRRDLRRDVQKELIEANGEIVQDFGLVAEQLKSVGDALSKLQATCTDMRRHMLVARAEANPLLDQASTLLKQREQVEGKQRILYAFNDHFLLSDHELGLLTSGVEPVGDDFFHVLVKAKNIHKDCQALLSSQSQRLGLEILEQSTRNLNSAYQKLYRSINREFKSLDLENPRINATVRRALRVLAERPTLFQNCLDTFAESRERTLSESFFHALTGQGPRGSSAAVKPIDFSAAEPLRYVGDMLAWAHSTTVSEREALEALFIGEGDEIAKGIAEGLESEPWARQPTASARSSFDSTVDPFKPKSKPSTDDSFDGARALSQLVNRSLAGVAHLLTQRLEQLIASHDDPVLAYKIANLVSFYHNIFTRLVSASGFLDTLRHAEATALDRFKTAMQGTIATIQADTTPDQLDLSGPDFLPSALENVKSLLKSYETSLTSSFVQPSHEETEAGLDVIYTEALDPILTTCTTLSSSLASPSKEMFLRNCLLQTTEVLASTSATLTKQKRAALYAQVSKLTTALTSHTHGFLLSTSGLSPLLAALAESTTAPKDARVFQQDALADTSAQLDAFLPSAVMDAEGLLSGMRDKDTMREVVRDAAERFVLDFEMVEQAVVRIGEDAAVERRRTGDEEEDDEDDEDEAVGALASVFPRTTEDVRVLLS